MAVYDRWHKAGPGTPCRAHKMVPSAAHGKGMRWQVRWRDDRDEPQKRNFRLKEGKNPDLHADAFWAKLSRDLDTGDYIDPDSAEITFRAYAEDIRKTRTHDDVTAHKLEEKLRLHVYPVIGGRALRELSKRPSLTQAWIKGMEDAGLAPRYARQIVSDVSGIYIAAMNDGLIGANPTRASSVTWPDPPPKEARAWPPELVGAMASALPERYRVIPYLGAGTGMRQGEIFGFSPDDVTFLGRDPHVDVVRQVKYIRGRMHFAPPKRRKTRSTPLAPEVAEQLARHIEHHPPVTVTLPWHDPRDRKRHGKPVTVRLLLSDAKGHVINRNGFMQAHWWAAQEKTGIVAKPEPGEKRQAAPDDGMHALRHTYASAVLGSGVDVLAAAAWMGDTPGVILATYAHFMPGREDGGRAAVSAFFGGASAPDVPSREAGNA